MMFDLLLSVAALTLQSPMMSLWIKQEVRIPGDEGLREVVEGFKVNWAFHSVLELFMGHIPIMLLEDFPADYYNHKGWHSILMQGMMNHLGQFMDVYIGWSGRVHYTRVFANTQRVKMVNYCLIRQSPSVV